METRKISVQQGTTAVPVLQSAEDYRLNAGGLWTPDPAGNRAVRSGVLPGPKAADGNAPCSVIATPSTPGSLTIKAGHFVVQGKTALSGVYNGTIDADKIRTITPLPTSGGYKAGRVLLHVYDQTYSDAQDGWDIEVLLGVQSASSVAAVLPAIPVTGTYLELRQFVVDSAGGLSFIGTPAPVTVPRAGVRPASATDATTGAYLGEYRDHPTLGLQRWNPSLGGTGGWEAGGGSPAPALVPLNTAQWANYADKNVALLNFERLHVVRIGSECRLRGLVALATGAPNITSGFATTVGTLPTEFVPPRIAMRWATVDGANLHGRVDINPTAAGGSPTPGVISFTAPAGMGQSEYVAFDCSWSLLNNV